MEELPLFLNAGILYTESRIINMPDRAKVRAADAKEGECHMRKFSDHEKKLEAVICNGCGRNLKLENGVLKEGCFEGKQSFGYFSSMDGEKHQFDLCEECYRKFTKQFAVPVEKQEITELL